MTSFGKVFQVMSRDRFRTINKIILVELAVIAGTLLWSVATRGIQSGEFFGATMSWSVPALFAAIILMSVANEHVYTRDTYRLIPIGETKLYTTNLLSSLLMFLYFSVIQVVLYAITSTIDAKFLSSLFADLMNPHYPLGEAIKIVIGLELMGLALVILSWTTISLVHLVVSATNNFLPNVSRRAVDTVLYIVVIYLVVRVAAFIFHEFNNLSGMMSAGMQTQFIVNIVGILVVAAIEAVINVVLLKKWVETIPN
ncbi:ABC transporter permease [Levilactobacillus angrenensis]|uniref:ABC transporter permease n=1 Tax=Levilactobacillus angrenensis TaxID=2486020 RepID=A0ABW1U877_9LACO|nr:ABC transporter permease [Levilactobacillus angrenensis]